MLRDGGCLAAAIFISPVSRVSKSKATAATTLAGKHWKKYLKNFGSRSCPTKSFR
jgi:hypothetical protein